MSTLLTKAEQEAIREDAEHWEFSLIPISKVKLLALLADLRVTDAALEPFVAAYHTGQELSKRLNLPLSVLVSVGSAYVRLTADDLRRAAEVKGE